LIRQTVRTAIDRFAEALARRQREEEKTSPGTKIALRSLYTSYRLAALGGAKLPSAWETGFRVFSQFDEDGVALFLLGAAGTGPAKFVEIGGGDGVWASNCANLALNLGFHGAFLDADGAAVARGRSFYRSHPDTSFHPPVFVEARVTRENVNPLLRQAGFEGEIDLLSIDIDGNDYWIWEAIECVSPRIVVIETHVELGTQSLVVPYEASFQVRPESPHHLGASPEAMTRLARRLGYRLVGANRFGFNAFYLREDLGRGLVPAIEVSELFRHDRNRERVRIFEEIRHLPFETV
jgi:hypothetical protein